MSIQPIQKTFSIGKKIIFVFLFAIFTVLLAFLVSRITFKDMLERVDTITSPDYKVRLVNQLTRDILQLDHIQHGLAVGFMEITSDQYLTKYKQIHEDLLILQSWFNQNPSQTQRLDSIQNLLVQRDSSFRDYLLVRQKMVSGENLETQLSSIGKIVSNTPVDSSIRTTEHQRITTTVSDEEAVSAAKEERSFLSRVFGTKKKEPTILSRYVQEEVNVQVDTIVGARSPASQIQIDQAVREIKAAQLDQSKEFIDREIELLQSSNMLIQKMMSLLESVEYEALIQGEIENKEAKEVVNDSVMRIIYILLFFLAIMAFMIYQILADIRKNNAYRKALEAAKEEAENHAAAKQRFLANISHELRTPLQSIIGYAEQMRATGKVESHMIGAVYQSSEHLLQIVNEVLDYSRIHSGKIILEEKNFNIESLIADVVTIVKQSASLKKLALSYQIQLGGSPLLFGDAYRIRQILFNLLSNALKFTHEGQVSLAASTVTYPTFTELNIAVKDTGIGIEENHLDKIFEHFEQAEHNNSGEYFGSGLGLSIVKGICEQMGGFIRVESEKGVGSTFYVQVVLKQADLSLQTDQIIHPKPKTLNPTGKVWVVDDDRLIVSLCKTILEKYNIPYQTFSTPQSLLATPLTSEVNKILMDIRMPGMSGLELIGILKQRALNQDQDLTIVACTAQALPDEQAQLLAQGFDDLLLKPFKEAELLRILQIDASPTPLPSKDPLVAFTDGDITLQDQLIQQFIKDCQEDASHLKIAYQQDNVEMLELILHRLAGRTAQMGFEPLSFRFRKMEIDVRNEDIPSIQEMDQLIHELLDNSHRLAL
jgi:signal transduction histidine kinase/DNA-binding response OmpR family regulator